MTDGPLISIQHIMKFPGKTLIVARDRFADLFTWVDGFEGAETYYHRRH